MSSEQIWDRLPDEPLKWFNRFLNYLHQPPSIRTMREACARTAAQSKGTMTQDRPNATWYERAKQWDWYGRAEAFDQKNHAVMLRDEAEDRKQMVARHLEGLGTLFAKAKKYIEENDFKSATEALTGLKLAITEERKAHGLPTHLLEVSTLTDEQLLSRYDGLIARLSRPGSGDDQARLDPAKEIEAEFDDGNGIDY